MDGAPEKKGFHFPASFEHFAEYIEAETIEAATEIYHKTKRPINPIQATDDTLEKPITASSVEAPAEKPVEENK